MSGAMRRITVVFIVQSLYNEYTPFFVCRTNSGYTRFTCRLRQAQVMSGAMLRTCLVRMIYVPATAGSGHVLRDSVCFSIWVRLTCIFSWAGYGRLTSWVTKGSFCALSTLFSSSTRVCDELVLVRLFPIVFLCSAQKLFRRWAAIRDCRRPKSWVELGARLLRFARA